MKVRPLHDKVLVKVVEAEEKTKGGIYIPETAAEKPQEGKVLEVGTGIILPDGNIKPLDVKKGDRVVYINYGGTEIEVDGEQCLILEEAAILAILDK